MKPIFEDTLAIEGTPLPTFTTPHELAQLTVMRNHINNALRIVFQMDAPAVHDDWFATPLGKVHEALTNAGIEVDSLLKPVELDEEDLWIKHLEAQSKL